MEHGPDTEPMKGARRIDGIKYRVDHLTDEELAGIHGHLSERHVRLVADIAFVESVLFTRAQDTLPFEPVRPDDNI